MSVGRRVVAVAGVVLILSGCTTTLSGSAQPVPQTTAEQAEVTADPTPAPEISAGTLVEAQRIAGATVLPEFIYPELTNNCYTLPMIYPERIETSIFVEGTALSIYTTYGFVAGWVTCRDALKGEREAIVFVAEMSDPDSAIVAARELAAKFVAANGAEPTEIRGFEDLPAVQTPAVVDGEDAIRYEVFQPVGRMLAYFSYADDLDAAQDDVGELLEEQRQLLGDFEPTLQEEIADLDPDAYELEGRTAEPPVEGNLYTGSYDLRGYLHLAIAPQIEAELLPDNNFQGMYLKSAADNSPGGFSYQFQVYELGSLEEADAVFAEFARIEQEEFTDRVIFQVPEDATIPCFYTARTDPTAPIFQRCYTREGRFLGCTDVFGVLDPTDITVVRGYVQEQIQLMRAP